MRKAIARLTLFLGLFASGLLVESSARAETQLGFEVGPLARLGDAAIGKSSAAGLSFAGRAGYRLSVPLLALTPEIKVTYDRVPTGVTVGAFRAMAGGRLAVGKLIAPVAFAHIGYGSAKGERGGIDLKRTGVAFDAGLGLDFTLIPLIDLGVYACFNKLKDNEGDINWLTVGAQVSLLF